MKRLETVVYVAAHQLYLRDPDVEWDGAYTNDPWSGGDGLGVAKGVIGVQSPRAAAHAPVFVELLDGAPGEAPSRFIKVTTASVDVSKGRLAVMGEENEESSKPLEFELAPGTYEVRVLYADLDTITYDDDDGAEHYVIQLWPGSEKEAEIVRGSDPVDEPVRTTTTPHAAAEADLKSDDASTAAHALVELARAGGVEEVARLGKEHPSRALRLLAVNALRLVGARDALQAFAESDDLAIRGNVGRALERLG
ncbi:Hypothetical protein A7982_06167 [Minicystis rosea]|nr:Hypothetical protein A7982_06167 [Minicystis rosea]